MFRRQQRIAIPIVLSPVIAVAAWLVLSTTAGLAYDVGPGSLETAPAIDTPGVPFPVTATFISSNGMPDSGFPVVFTSSSLVVAAAPARSDGLVLMAHTSRPFATVCTAGFDPVTENTNSSGVATTEATIPLGCFGTFTLTATIPGLGSVSTTVTTIAPGTAGAFPNTSAQRTGGLGTGILAGAILAALLLPCFLVVWLRSLPRRRQS